MPKRFNVIRRNLELVFPELDEAARETLANRNLEETIAGFTEAMHILVHGYETVVAGSAIRGREVLDAALATGKNVLLIGAHFTPLESCGCAMGADAPVEVINRRQNLAVGNYLILRHRRKLYAKVIDRGDTTGILNAFRDTSQQHIVWMAPDQDMGKDRSVFVPFLGVEKAATLKITPRIAERYDLVTLFVEFAYQDQAPKWIVEYRAIEGFPTGDELGDVAKLNQVIGDAVRRRPEQYYWIHRRFKTLEDGSTRKY